MTEIISAASKEKDFVDFLFQVAKVTKIFKGKNISEYSSHFDVNVLKKAPPKKGKPIVHDLNDLFVGVSWEVSQMTGGHYTGTSAEFVEIDPIPVDINPVLCKILIQMGKDDYSFVRYTAFIGSLIQSGTSSDRSDCYGNSYTYATRYVNLREFYDIIKG